VNSGVFERFPALATDRLHLRELCPEDAPSLFEVFRDDEVTRYYDVETMTEVAPAAALVAFLQQRFASRVGIRWAIVERASGSFLGTIGFNSINQSANKSPLGYELGRAAWGRGFATEAVRAVVRFGHQELGLRRIEAAVMLGNEASARVLEKAGFIEEGLLRAYGYWKGSYHDLRMFSILPTPAAR
jgi:ribosomal-protein-alanine N-acetyltransferase